MVGATGTVLGGVGWGVGSVVGATGTVLCGGAGVGGGTPAEGETKGCTGRFDGTGCDGGAYGGGGRLRGVPGATVAEGETYGCAGR